MIEKFLYQGKSPGAPHEQGPLLHVAWPVSARKLVFHAVYNLTLSKSGWWEGPGAVKWCLGLHQINNNLNISFFFLGKLNIAPPPQTQNSK